MTYQEAIKHLEEILTDDQREWSCAECKAEHEELLSWLKHYAQIRQIVHNWSCDYPPVNPEHKFKHTKEEYFDMIIDTFAVEGEGYGYPEDV